MDLVVEVIMQIVKCVGGPIVRYLKDQIKFNHSLEEFKRRKDDLPNLILSIESKLNRELRYGMVAKREVQRWLDDAKGFIAKPEVEDEVNGRGCLSCCCRVKILKERDQELNEIYNRGGEYAIQCLVDVNPLALRVGLITSVFQGNKAVKEDILACLKGEDVTMLGVWGMGGVGKTTIMMHVYNDLLRERKFKRIIWVTMTQNFDIYNLQEQIASSLNVELEKCQNTTNRASMLSHMLEEQKPYLLILDDVWCSFKLEDVGIPKPNVTNGCKLVLTTRLQDVACSMDCRIIQVKTLSEEEALQLFLNVVGGIDLSGCGRGIKSDLVSTLMEIVDECDGLPLALITVAGSLKGKSESQLWILALNQLRNCKRTVVGTNADEFEVLKFSYERLEKQQIQYCFLYCALYPEDYKISKEEIIERWIDEGFIEEDSRQSMWCEGYGILEKLVDSSMLELIEDEASGDCVRMHDLMRDMALHITRTSPRFLVEAGKSLSKLPKKVICVEGVEKVSLMHNYIEKIPSSMASSTCASLTTLLLAHNYLSTIPESVFEHMPELKILDLSFNWMLFSLPNSVSKLVKLTTLLLESTSLEKVPSLSGLGFLQKLNLRGTNIAEVPEGLGLLKNLKCLFLCGSESKDILEIDEIADEVLSSLSKLEELIVDWSRIKLKGDVVGRMKTLEVFHGWFPIMNDMRIFLECRPNGLSGYFIVVGSNKLELYSVITKLPRYKKMMVFEETSIVGENTLLPSVQVLCINACHDIRSLNDFSVIKDATDLRRCLIQNCDGMEFVLSSWINNPVLQTLEDLHLNDLYTLDGLFEANVMVTSSPPSGTFSCLKAVSIFRCQKMKKLFPSWKLVEYLQSLERIEVYNCREMEEIIASDPEERQGGDIMKELALQKLESLELGKLPALKSICSKRVVMVCNSLENITISDCKGLRRIPLYLPLVGNAHLSPPPSLKKINIYQGEREWWNSLEWDHPNAKHVLRPVVGFVYE